MKAVERERQDWRIITTILVAGFLLVILAGQLALRFSPGWLLNTNMDSHLDPNSAFLTHRPSGWIEPVDAAILTLPAWIHDFLTPGAPLITGTPFPTPTKMVAPTTTVAPPIINTVIPTSSLTSTVVYFPPTRTAIVTSKPHSTSTSTRAPTSQVTSTSTSTPTVTASSTSTATGTPTFTETATATQTPVPIPTDPVPPEIGTTPDGVTYDLPAGGTLTLGMNLVASGDPGFDLVYYEFPAGSGILMDWVIVQVSDGTNWYTVFNWSDDIADTNSNLNFNNLSLPVAPVPATPPFEEVDQRDILAADLYASSGFSTGIAIDVDSMVPPGIYSYIRFIAPGGDADGQLEIDAVEVFP